MTEPGATGGRFYRQLADALNAGVAEGKLTEQQVPMAAEVMCAIHGAAIALFGKSGGAVNVDDFILWCKEKADGK